MARTQRRAVREGGKRTCESTYKQPRHNAVVVFRPAIHSRMSRICMHSFERWDCMRQIPVAMATACFGTRFHTNMQGSLGPALWRSQIPCAAPAADM